ncbi:MAG: MNIO family bufferin maturase [Hyphomicrobiaceae bacterium]
MDRQPAHRRDKPEFLGFGLGLRPQHYDDIFNGDPPIDWFEVISENYMVPGGQPLRILDEMRDRYPLVMHGVSMSIASTSPLDLDYLQDLKALAKRVEPKWISDHLCWTGVHGVNLHDLLPIPYTNEALDHVSARVHKVQEILGRPLTLENVSSYIAFEGEDMTEWEFLSQLARRTECFLLFDVNNVYVGARNHGYDPMKFLNGIPRDAVVQFHLAGHEDHGDYVVDTHDHDVCDEVFDLYRAALERFGPVSTMIERDDYIPPLADVVAELERARAIATDVFGTGDAPRSRAPIMSERM